MESTTEIAAEVSKHTTDKVQLQSDILQNIPATALTVTPDGQLDFINRFFLDVTGQTLEACTVSRDIWNRGGSDLPPFLILRRCDCRHHHRHGS
jgi:hypothetical protein